MKLLSVYLKKLSYCYWSTQVIKRIYNIARVLPYLIPIGVIMAHFSTYARPCVHSMTCVNQTNSDFLRLVFTKFPQKWKKIAKNYPTFLLELSLLQLYRAQRKHRDEWKP